MSAFSIALFALAIFGVLSSRPQGMTPRKRRAYRRESDLGPALQRRWLRRN